MIYFHRNFTYLSDKHKKRIKQYDIANTLNLKPNTVSAYKKGKAVPSFENLEKIAEIFDVNLNDLLTVDLQRQDDLRKNNTYPELSDVVKVLSEPLVENENIQSSLNRLETLFLKVLEQLDKIERMLAERRDK